MEVWWVWVGAAIVGVIAGIINTLAGSGSLLTLPMLIFLGLPADVANGTNRVGIVVQSMVAVATFKHGGKLEIGPREWKLAGIAFVGSVLGALIAVQMNEVVMRIVIAVVMLGSLVVILAKPGQFAAKDTKEKPLTPLILLMFLAIGVYAGFIQASVGILLLVALVAGTGYDIVKANGLKLFLTIIFTSAAIPVFAWNSQIDWGLGALMAGGQSLGAWMAARFAVKSDKAADWIQRLIVVVIIFSVIKLLVDL